MTSFYYDALYSDRDMNEVQIKKEKEENLEKQKERMSLSDFERMIEDARNWRKFKSVFNALTEDGKQ